MIKNYCGCLPDSYRLDFSHYFYTCGCMDPCPGWRHKDDLNRMKKRKEMIFFNLCWQNLTCILCRRSYPCIIWLDTTQYFCISIFLSPSFCLSIFLIFLCFLYFLAFLFISFFFSFFFWPFFYLFLVACYATLHPALSVCPSVGPTVCWSVRPSYFSFSA